MRKNPFGVLFLLALLLLTDSCSRKAYHVVSIDAGRVLMDSRYDEYVPAQAQDLLDVYKSRVDSIMSPVIAHSAEYMTSSYPEGLLSNLISDVIREMGEKITGRHIDIAIMNLGGIRTSMPKGDVTFGNVFEITPFENSLAIMEVRGAVLREVFSAMCKRSIGCQSGGRIVRSEKGDLLTSEVSGEPLDDERIYTVATIDYLAEGNDGFTAWAGTPAQLPEGATLRQMFLDYLTERTRRGEIIRGSIDGRFVTQK